MASLYGAFQLARGFDPLSPATPLRTHFAFLSRLPNAVSTFYWGNYVKLYKPFQEIRSPSKCGRCVLGHSDRERKTPSRRPSEETQLSFTPKLGARSHRR